MPTFLFDSIVFGPVRSRRLGVSLGINLLPLTRKMCSYDCIYCECGWTHGDTVNSEALPSRTEVRDALRDKLSLMKEQGTAPDVITYAGNGEPTLHPDFAAIIDDSVAIRSEFFPEAKVSVLSNGSMIHRKKVRDALKKVDMNILKLDSAFPETVRRMNRPQRPLDLARYESYLNDFGGRFIIQTLFVRGMCDGEVIDNASPEEISAWLEVISRLKPQSVMIYTIDRDTPDGNELRKVPAGELHAIADRVEALGIPASVSG